MANEWRGGGGSRAFARVMTEEQMEILRGQIAAYAAICEQLVEMHRTITAKSSRLGRWGNPYADSRNTPSKPRWCPSAKQLQILERIFNEETCNPGKQKVPEIAAELSLHGQVTETNVYNWFQNRRARSKRKQKPTMVDDSNAEPEVVENKEELLNDENKTQDLQTADSSSMKAEENVSFQKSMAMVVSDVDPSSGKAENELFQEFGDDCFEQMDLYRSLMQQSPGMEDLLGDLDVGESFDSILQQDDFNTTGRT